MRFNECMECANTSKDWSWCERLWLLAFVCIEAAMLWQSYAPALLRLVSHGQ
jgi:hypothetical protein